MRHRQQYRTQFSALIGSSDTPLAPGNDKRIALILCPPIPLTNEEVNKSVQTHAFNSAATGAAATYTVPAGQQATLTSASYHLIAGSAPTVQLWLTRGGTTSVIAGLSTDVAFLADMPLQSGDIVTIQVTGAGVGSTIDAFLGIFEDALSQRVTVSFIQPAVLDVGLNLYPGDAPVVLSGEHIGGAFREEIRAIANVANTRITVIDITEVDCPCQE